MLLGLIIISNVISRPKEIAEETKLPTKNVEVYTIGESPEVTVQAQVEKSGVVKIVSLGAGVVQSINVEVGQEVDRGTTIVSMSTNYQGGNIFSAQRQLAQVQYKNVLDTFDTQKDLISKQKELASKSDENADRLREISNQSLEASRSLINLNNDTLTTLEAQQAELEATNVGDANDAAILQTKQLRSQLASGNNQLESALRASEFSGASDKPPAEISNLTKDITIKQLEIQEKALSLNKEVSRLSVVLASINEAIMFPSSPFWGVIERIYVKEGEVLSPGMPIAQIKGDLTSLIAIAFLSKEMADGISRAKTSTLRIGENTYEAAPFYVSAEATDGGLYSASFSIPAEFSDQVQDKGYIAVDVPLDFPKTGGAVPFIPIDSVFQTQDQAYVYLSKDGRAQSRRLVLGQVLGRFVEVQNGLSEKDQVILNRNVIQGDPVKIVNSK